jgi:hypothetical protein
LLNKERTASAGDVTLAEGNSTRKAYLTEKVVKNVIL